jgi:hypothetical protein
MEVRLYCESREHYGPVFLKKNIPVIFYQSFLLQGQRSFFQVLETLTFNYLTTARSLENLASMPTH